MLPINYSVLLLFLVCFLSCKPDTSNSTKKNESQKPLVEPSKNLAAPKDERLTWQKPDLVISKLGQIENKTIADLGAGIGYFAFKLLPKCEKVIAIDIDSESVQILKGFRESLGPELVNKFEVRLATTTSPNLKTEEVDVIFIVNTITYISDRQAYLANLSQYLKKGGQIFIVDFKTKRLPAGPVLNIVTGTPKYSSKKAIYFFTSDGISLKSLIELIS